MTTEAQPPFAQRTAWSRSIQTPLRAFLSTETGGAGVLLAAALAALAWINLDASSYEHFWETELAVDLGDWGISLSLREWVNTGLMAFFFFVVGLEARRELEIVACVDDQEATTRIVELVKAEFPLVPVLARAFDRRHALALAEAGVDWQVRETFDAGLALGAQTLATLGVEDAVAAEVMEEVRQRDARRFERELVGGIRAGRALILGNLPGWQGGAE
jgi:hypothetical protein